MSRRKEPSIPNANLDQLLAGIDAAAPLSQGGLLDSLKKAFAERALNAEMNHHLRHDDQIGNNRNGYGRKTLATGGGRIEIEVPRDRAGSFDPQLIAKYRRRFSYFESWSTQLARQTPPAMRREARDASCWGMESKTRGGIGQAVPATLDRASLRRTTP